MSRQTISNSGALVALSAVLFSGQAKAQAFTANATIEPGAHPPIAGLVLPPIENDAKMTVSVPQPAQAAKEDSSFVISPSSEGIPFPKEPGPNTIVTFNIRLSAQVKSRFCPPGQSGAGMPSWVTRVPADKADFYLSVIRAVTEAGAVSSDIEGLKNVPSHARALLGYFASFPDSQVYVSVKDREPTEIANDARMREHWDDPSSSWPSLVERQTKILRGAISDINGIVFHPMQSFHAWRKGVIDAFQRHPALPMSLVLLLPAGYLLRELRLSRVARSRESDSS